MPTRVRDDAVDGVSMWLLVAGDAASVDTEDFLVVVTVAAVAGTVAALLGGRGLLVPTVVVELLLGVVIGPQVLGLETSAFLEFFHTCVSPASWEANHVWLIFVLVVLWTAFSEAFASIFSTLFIPLSLAALGIVLR